MSLKALPLICLALFAPAAAHAQYQMMSPMLYEGPRISLEAHAAANGSAAKATPARALSAQSLKFRPDPARRQVNLANFVARSRAADRAAGDSLAKVLAQGDIIERIKPDLAKYGLSVDSVADAYTVWWITAWQASRGLDDDVTPATAAAVRGQFLAAAAASPQIAAANDSAKQDMSESLLIQALLLNAAVSQAKNDPSQMQAVKAGAAQAGRSMSVDFAKMELTDQGFVFGLTP